jgi:hypothetical protein
MENKSGHITHYCDLEITRGLQIHVQRFYVANLGTDCFILGFLWLYEFNPEIDWRHREANSLPLSICPTTHQAEGSIATKTICTAREMHARLLWTHEWEEDNEIIVNCTNFTQEWAIEANQNKNLNAIPEEYHQHAKVFSEEEAQHFPPE